MKLLYQWNLLSGCFRLGDFALIPKFHVWFVCLSWRCGKIRLAFSHCNSQRWEILPPLERQYCLSLERTSLSSSLSFSVGPRPSFMVSSLPILSSFVSMTPYFKGDPNLRKLVSLCSLGLEKFWIKVALLHESFSLRVTYE